MEIVMLTGFLGAGKTTFMQKLLNEYAHQRKIGVIVNEFGKVDIDTKLLEQDGVTMSELSNGSIFCACIKDKFVDSLVEMSRRDLDYVFIEASGLADPSNMGFILDGIKRATGDRLKMKGSICITDAETFMSICDLLPALARQVKHSEVVFVNKRSCVDDVELNRIHDKIKEWNESVVILDTDYCSVDIEDVMSLLNGNVSESEETTNTDSTRLPTVVVKGEKIITTDDLNDFLNSVAGSTYRLKGFVNTDQGCMEVSCTGMHITITPWDKGPEETNLVCISSVGVKIVSVVAGWINRRKDTGLYIS